MDTGGEYLTGVLGAWAGKHASPGVARKHRRLQTKLLPLVLVRYRVEFFDAFVRCEAPCPDVTSTEVAVIVPIQRAGSAVEVDLMPLSKQGQAIGDPCGSAWNGPAGRSGDFSQMIADCGAVDTACSLGRKS